MRDVTLYLAKYCLAFREHNEKESSHNRDNFIDLAYVIAQHNGILIIYIEKQNNSGKSNTLNLLSNINQNIILKCLAEEVV